LLDANVLAEVRTEVRALRKVLDGAGDLMALREAYQRLEGAAFKIAESMYGNPG
jgi:molecular chaperone DnaK